MVVPWSAVDTCDANGYVSHGPCLPDNTCTPSLHNCYNWAYIDNSLDAYINSTNITWSSAHYYNPVWSVNGRLAFVSENGDFEIYI